MPFYHIYGAMLTGGFLAAGATQVLMERFEVQRAVDIYTSVPLSPNRRHFVTYQHQDSPPLYAPISCPGRGAEPGKRPPE
jgi:long-chain acyl-CoA synthetase